ncbi:MAG: hypothetical protein H6626_14180 [Pseudobdellovibrionaceae bacterium]|nr:hypothetical protein [Bdellovibrionales bacterium]USN47318.1 MAG: hypothetical protein H6626_14180 [Pseudobdellovibrionaceae bacterium]
MKAKQLYYEKQYIGKAFILEVSIWKVPTKDLFRFPEGYKYSLILVEARTGKKVLMDNHHPKGHHVHLDGLEFGYVFISLEILVKDFKSFCLKHLGVSI